MVSEPPSSMLRAAPKKRFGPLQRVAVDAAREHLARRRHDRVVGARQARDRVEQDDHVLLVLDQALGLLDDHLGHLHVPLRRLVEGRADHLAAHRALHVGHLFGPLVDEQHDQVNLGVIRGDRVGDRLQQHGLAGAGRRHDQAALALAERRHQVHDARREVLGVGLELDFLLGVERGEVLEEDAFLAAGRRLEVDRLDLDQGEVTLAFLRAAGSGRPRCRRCAGRTSGSATATRRCRRGRPGSCSRAPAGTRSRRAAPRARPRRR